MQITSWYTRNFEDRLKGRYITINHILPLLDHYREVFNISVAGFSETGVEIPLVSFGKGGKKVLIWSQMHGNESTTTKALFDFFKFITSNKQADKGSAFKTYILCASNVKSRRSSLVYS